MNCHAVILANMCGSCMGLVPVSQMQHHHDIMPCWLLSQPKQLLSTQGVLCAAGRGEVCHSRLDKVCQVSCALIN